MLDYRCIIVELPKMSAENQTAGTMRASSPTKCGSYQKAHSTNGNIPENPNPPPTPCHKPATHTLPPPQQPPMAVRESTQTFCISN
jgi:hypothetical protein